MNVPCSNIFICLCQSPSFLNFQWVISIDITGGDRAHMHIITEIPVVPESSVTVKML